MNSLKKLEHEVSTRTNVSIHAHRLRASKEILRDCGEGPDGKGYGEADLSQRLMLNAAGRRRAEPRYGERQNYAYDFRPRHADLLCVF